MSIHPIQALVREQGSLPVTARLVLRGVTILSIVWQGAWILPDSTLWPWKQEALLPRPFMWMAYLCWIGLIVTTWGPRRFRPRYIVFARLDVTFLYVSAILLFLTDNRFAQDAWIPATSLVNLAAAMTGLLLTTSAAVELLSVAIGLEFVVLVLQSSQSGGPDAQDIVLIPVYALCAGIAAIVARRGLIFAAERVDLVQRDTVEAESRLLGIRLIQQRIARQEQRLHETVLNTLNAIARGGMRLDESLRTRCQDAIAVMRKMRTIDATVPSMDAQDWRKDLDDSVTELRDLGMAVYLSIDVRGALPPEVYAACITAIRETCTNARRHSGASSVSIEISTSGGSSRARASSLSIRIGDNGRGFDPDTAVARFGISHAIRAPLTELGGRVVVTSAPGSGVTIDLGWDATSHDVRDFALRDLGMSARVFAAPVLTAFSLFGLVSMLMTGQELTQPLHGWLALLAYVGMSAVIIWSTRSSGIPGWLVIAICLLAPLVYRLQGSSFDPNDVGHWTEWASECIAAMFLVVAAAGRPWWAWLAALVSWIVIQGGFPLELIQPGSALIYAGALYARSVRLNARRFDRINDQRLQELANAAVAEREVDLLGRRYALLDESDALSMFGAIAGGVIDPSDATVRARADREEQYIRAVMRIGAVDDPVHEVAAEILQWGRQKGIAVEIDLPSGHIDVTDVSDLRLLLDRAYTLAPGATSARLSAREEGSRLVVRLVISGCIDCETARMEIGRAAIVCLGEGDLMVEARYDI
ncbi:MAG: sensor histidine kinase [Actinomycetes bacterium]